MYISTVHIIYTYAYACDNTGIRSISCRIRHLYASTYVLFRPIVLYMKLSWMN